MIDATCRRCKRPFVARGEVGVHFFGRALCYGCYHDARRHGGLEHYPATGHRGAKGPRGPYKRYVGPCRHCGAETGRVACRPRKLCEPCHKDDAIRRLYVPARDCLRRGVPDRTGCQPVPAERTEAMPGSPEKVLAMCQRAERGEQLFHPQDGRGHVPEREQRAALAALEHLNREDEDDGDGDGRLGELLQEAC